MAIQTINYDNKVALNENPGIADVNKVKDTDMNEIKSVVNNNANNIGDLSNLQTTETSNIVGAINSLISVSLFDAPAGSLSVTLSDSASNYKMLYIETIGLKYTDYIKKKGFVIANPNGKYVSQSYGYYNSINNQIYIVSPIFYINGTSITISNNQAGTVGANNAYLGTNDCIGITKVLGYK